MALELAAWLCNIHLASKNPRAGDANLALHKGHYPMSKKGRVLWDFNGSIMFNHSDFNLPYHNTELALESKAIKPFKIYEYFSMHKLFWRKLCTRNMSEEDQADVLTLSSSIKFMLKNSEFS
jgi:hypothetical protein